MNLKDVKLGLDLTQANAVQWFQRMELLLRSIECWKVVNEGAGEEKVQNAARLAISCNVGDDLIHNVSPTATPKQIWDGLKKQFSGVSAARKMALSRSQASFRKSADETLDQFINRGEQLRAELASANMLKEDEFVVTFLAALDETMFASWAQAISARARLPTYADLIESLRCTFFQKLHTSSATTSQSEAYQASGTRSNQQCDYCHKQGHTILQCFKLKADQRAAEQPNAGRGRGRGRFQGRGRGRFQGRGRGSNANYASNSSAFICIAANKVSTDRSKWLFDSATTDHMVNDPALLHDARPMQSQCTVANKQTAEVSAIGTVYLTNQYGKRVTLKEVLLVPTLQHNLISLSRADAAGMSYTGRSNKIVLRGPGRDQSFLLLADLIDGLYEINCTPELSGAASSNSHTANLTQTDNAILWHRRFGHAGHSTLAKMSRGETVQGLPPATAFEANLQSTAVCTPCAEGKMKRESFELTHQRAAKKLAKLHTDIAGPFPTTPGKSNYYLMIVDDYSGYKIVVPIARKSDAADALKSIIPHLESKYSSKVDDLRFDRDAVFLSNHMQSWCKQHHIEPQPTSGYSPQENGHAERAIGTISEIRDALMADSGLKKMFWAEAVVHATYLSNIMCSDGGQSPWQLLKGSKPDISNLHIWGCTCHYKIPAQKLKKSQLPAKSGVGKFVGYAQPNFKSYRVLLPSGSIIISRDVKFDESAPPASNSRIDMCSDLMEAVTQHTQPDHQPRQAQPQQQQLPEPQPQPQLQQPVVPQSQQQQQQPVQPGLLHLMADNPLFDAAANDPSQSTSAQPTPRRNPPRNRQAPEDPYQKYLHGFPQTQHVNFHL